MTTFVSFVKKKSYICNINSISQEKKMDTVFDFTVKDRKGNNVALNSYQNEVILIVNTAINSEHASQYKELEDLYEKYHAQGFAVLDFPSNQPTKSCPGTDEMVHNHIKEKYETEYPRFKKVKVNGADAEPLYKFLVSMKEGDITEDFTKFLINRRGRVVARFAATTPFTDIEKEIETLL